LQANLSLELRRVVTAPFASARRAGGAPRPAGAFRGDPIPHADVVTQALLRGGSIAA